jgi:hypothetical protein
VLHSVGAMAPVRGRHFFEGRAQVVPLHAMARRSETSLLALALGRFGAAPSQDGPFVVVLTSDKAELEQVSEVCVCICVQVLGFVGLHQLVAWSQPRVSAQTAA